ncbi:helix-turn-helix domain-containing protein [Alkalibacillus almallahensis]|uniref:helix-turn-helix domain-containing protein n=1 Tax=Alkalibacillus almallahensis TaxID=1379154 RepID=UPI00141E503D|nr:helix-turn-helix domain-containing protein [Alkalibacillus almallahensis]NIK12330.1 uncharacterized protein YpbB [Alkalibacillus almallahensis]
MSFSRWLLPRLKQIEGERTPRSVLHILRGKKSAQTFQDSRLFRLTAFYHVLPKLSVETFDQAINQLKKDGLIEEQDSLVVITEMGEQFCQDDWRFELNGMDYGAITRPFYIRLQLLIQSVSNLIHKQTQFFPITDNESVQASIKKLFNDYDPLAQNGDVLYDELNRLFRLLNENEANLMMLTISGSDQIGLSYQQLAEKWQTNPIMIELSVQSALHQWLRYISSNPDSFNLIKQLIPKQEENRLTESALVTKHMYNRGMSIDQIVEKRGLKPSTIEDHIVELAMKEYLFSIREFISLEDEKRIRHVLEEDTTKRLRKIKEQLDDQLSYFQIRLVIARLGQEKEAISNG